MINIAINGLGRIGRCVAKIVAKTEDMQLVAINATGDEYMIQYNLRYDSVHGVDETIEVKDGYIFIGKEKAKLFSQRDPSKIDFASCGADVVLECTGAFLTTQLVQPFIDNGVKKVVMSAPAKDDTATYVFGANEDEYKAESIISNASCTTNALAPVAKLLDENFGIVEALMTTIHSYTSSQPILDSKHSKDPRKSRAGAINLIPTSTGAAKAISKVLPNLKGKINGQAIRVPTPNVSMVDLTVNLKQDVTVDMINDVFIKASQTTMKGILGIDDIYRVSNDFVGSHLSTVVPLDTTQVASKNMAKVLSWYDNEWGYSSRLVDMARLTMSYHK
ncbi:MAG: type I glyceraldehyde-3-phosphate dehydrogenase [Campylobacteraceae bacterium 4484_166]|nr:MAG: type I glyceraldehyde-3-phosphate dehydrogenase [Campylobacteraceae bacterium 4484_166]